MSPDRTADYWTSRVSAETVPAWDLDIADPGAPRDSSAAAIAAYGLLALAAVDPDNSRAGAYRAHALAMLATLIEPPWVTDLSGGAGILQRQAFSVPLDPREGTYAWGDTFLLKALASS
jgi:unsaturated chondroitin disaccharide hydrolase